MYHKFSIGEIKEANYVTIMWLYFRTITIKNNIFHIRNKIHKNEFTIKGLIFINILEGC